MEGFLPEAFPIKASDYPELLHLMDTRAFVVTNQAEFNQLR